MSGCAPPRRTSARGRREVDCGSLRARCREQMPARELWLLDDARIMGGGSCSRFASHAMLLPCAVLTKCESSALQTANWRGVL